MSGYTVKRLEDIDELTDGRAPWRPVRHDLGITAFGVNAWTGHAAGDRIINDHDEADDGNEELYYVVEGRAVFELDGERVEAPAGTFVFVQPAVKRTAFAEEPGTTLLAVGGVPGKPYEPLGWELWEPFRQLYEAGEYDNVVDEARETIESPPQYPLPLYNLACCESLTGRTDDAIAHLRQAIERYDQFREYARNDSDFDPIRQEAAFQELVGSA